MIADENLSKIILVYFFIFFVIFGVCLKLFFLDMYGILRNTNSQSSTGPEDIEMEEFWAASKQRENDCGW